MRVYYSAWGSKANDLQLPAYAMARECETKIEAVARAIERKLGVVAMVRYDNTRIERRVPVANQYQLTLGTPLRDGGMIPRYQIWVEVAT